MKNTKIGDVFVVNIDNGNKKYFQYIISDMTQLNSDVIRSFSKEYPQDFDPSLLEIVTDDVAFYAHCVTKLGVTLNYWQVVGNIKVLGDTEHILFRDSDDYGNSQIKVSEKWWVWKINEEPKFVGKLVDEYKHAEIGVVINPRSIVNRIKTGQYDGIYPAYE